MMIRETVLGSATAGPSPQWDHSLMLRIAMQSAEERRCSGSKVHVMKFNLRIVACDGLYVTTAPIFDIESTPSVRAPHGKKVPRIKETEDVTMPPEKYIVFVKGCFGCLKPKDVILVAAGAGRYKCIGWFKPD